GHRGQDKGGAAHRGYGGSRARPDACTGGGRLAGRDRRQERGADRPGGVCAGGHSDRGGHHRRRPSGRPRRRGGVAGAARPAGEQRQHAGPAPDATAGGDVDRRPPAGVVHQRRGAAGAHGRAAPVAEPVRRGDPLAQLGRGGPALRDLGPVRRQQGRPRPRHPHLRGRVRRACLRRGPRGHAHRDAPGRLPRRGHLRPAASRDGRAPAAGAAGEASLLRPLPRGRVRGGLL
ncbi:MAG: Putative oxidoreductase SCO1803, partial [uncultured Nocardioides sp.]